MKLGNYTAEELRTVKVKLPATFNSHEIYKLYKLAETFSKILKLLKTVKT